MATALVLTGIGIFVVGVVWIALWVRATVRRDKELDAEAIASTEANKQRAEEAHEGSHRPEVVAARTTISDDDEKPWERSDREFEAKWGAFLSEPVHAWARERLIEDFKEIKKVYEDYGKAKIAVYDWASVGVGHYSSPEELKVEMLLNEHTGDYHAVSDAIEAEYQDHVSHTYRWTETDEILLREMLDAESVDA